MGMGCQIAPSNRPFRRLSTAHPAAALPSFPPPPTVIPGGRLSTVIPGGRLSTVIPGGRLSTVIPA